MLLFPTFLHLPEGRALIPSQRLTTEKQTPAGSWAVSCVWLQNVHPRCSSAGDAEEGSGGVERQWRGAHCELECGCLSGRATSGLKTRDKRVSKKGIARGQAHSHGEAGTVRAPKRKKKHEQKFRRGRWFTSKACQDNRRFSKALTHQKKRKRVRETCERFLAITSFSIFAQSLVPLGLWVGCKVFL